MLNTSLKFMYELFNNNIEFPSVQDFGAIVNFILFRISEGNDL